jgi:hypothetical protein
VILASAVSARVITAVQAWPEFFGSGPGDPPGEPGAGGFTLEKATPQSFAADMAALVQSSSRVTLREPAPGAEQDPGHAYVPDTEWT